MNSEPNAAEYDIYVKGTINQYKCKKEERQHHHVYELREKTSEKPRYLNHFCHKLGVTKVINKFFSHKYLILVTKTAF